MTTAAAVAAAGVSGAAATSAASARARFRRFLGCRPLPSFFSSSSSSLSSSTSAALASAKPQCTIPLSTNSSRCTGTTTAAVSALAAAVAAVCGYYVYSRIRLAPRLSDPLFRTPAGSLAPPSASTGAPSKELARVVESFVKNVLTRNQRFFAGIPPGKEAPADVAATAPSPREVLESHVATVPSNFPGEDRYSVNRIDANRLLFGVYDGHAGHECSDRLARLMPAYVAEQLAASPADPKAALTRAYERFDADLISLAETAMTMEKEGQPIHNVRETLMPAVAGSVLVNMIAQPDKLYIAHAGDCRAVLGSRSSSGWTLKRLTNDHDASNPAEVERMMAEHPGEEEAVVRFGRVLGHLQPFRAMGDARYKWMPKTQAWVTEALRNSTYPYRHAIPGMFSPPYVTARPEVTEVPIGPNDEFVVLATDGLWERLSDEQVITAVGSYIDPSTAPPKSSHMALGDTNAATHVIRNAFGGDRLNDVADLLRVPPPDSRNYRDDITVLVVFLKPQSQGRPPISNELREKAPLPTK